MNYSAYTEESIIKRFMYVSEYKKGISHNIDTFDDALVKAGCFSSKSEITPYSKFDIVKYAKYYCEMDCVTLAQGFKTMRSWIWNVGKVDILNFLTVASFTFTLQVKYGCFEDVCQLGGSARDFIHKCTVGGRCMLNNNQKIHIKDKPIVDFDAVGLYAAAMTRIKGFPIGPPHRIPSFALDYDLLKRSTSQFFVKVHITSIGIPRSFPLLSSINSSGVRVFSNSPGIYYLDDISLSDLIKFQRISFTILDGIYFDEGFNTKIKSFITDITSKRKVFKDQGNPIQYVYKLIANTAFGKCMQKSVDTTDKIVYFSKRYNYICNNYHWIQSTHRLTPKFYHIKQKNSLTDHFNFIHCACVILSTSKSIMNEPMCLAEDLDLFILYQDTDSMHLLKDDLSILSNAFKHKYNLGQFHSDFILEGSVCDVISTEFIGLSKKNYCDVLSSSDSHGNPISGYHVRSKGIGTLPLLHKADSLNISVSELYLRAFNGESFDVDLTCNGTKVNFATTKDFKTKTLFNFFRTFRA